MIDDCGPNGSIDATVSASGFQPFVADITINTGFATILVIDAQTQEPLYVCTWNPVVPDVAGCFPYTTGGV